MVPRVATLPSISLTVALSSKIGVPVKPKSWELGEELLDGPVVLAELRAVALVEDEYHPLVSELLQPLLES